MIERMRLRQAVGRALADEMEHDPTVILMGEDIGAAGGAFKATEGLFEQFGPRRVLDTPISEMGFVGAGVGAAATGLRPVVEIMFIEFLGVALDELVTEGARMRYLSRGRLSVPLTVRAAAGAGLGFGCQHSQMLEHWFTATPGLKVVVPSDPASAYGLLRAAIRDDDPTVVLEHKALYGDRGEVTVGEEGLLPLGRARLRRTGGDVTVVGIGATVKTALEAADLAGGEWSADVVDLLTLVPWDQETVIESVTRTGRLVVVEEGVENGGWGADIVAAVTQQAFGSLVVPPLRITAPDAPIPYSGGLESQVPARRRVRGGADLQPAVATVGIPARGGDRRWHGDTR